MKDDLYVVYTPPRSEREIIEYLSNLERYINDDTDNIDPLIKLAVIHYQFEAGLRVTRKTAVSYLDQLEQHGFSSSQKIGRERIYCNDRQFRVVKGSNR